MFNLQGKAFVTNLKEVTPKLISGTVYTFRKEGDEFIPTFIKCKIVGNAITNLILNNICDKDKIEIKSSSLQANNFTNKDGKQISSLELVIFELDKYEEVETQDIKENRFKRK